MENASAEMPEAQQDPQRAQHEPAAQPVASARSSSSASLSRTNTVISRRFTTADTQDVTTTAGGVGLASWGSAGLSSSQLDRHASALAHRLQERAAAAMAVTQAAVAPSSTLSGVTEYQVQAAAPDSETLNRPAAAAAVSESAVAPSIFSGATVLQPQAAVPEAADGTQAQAAAAIASSEAATAPSSTVSGIDELHTRAAAAMALAAAAGAPSSTLVSGLTELAAAGAAMSQAASSLGAGNPFGLSSAHSADGYALVNAISAASSTVSGLTELCALPSATAAAAVPVPAGQEGSHATVARSVSLAKGPDGRAAAAMALSDAVGAASSVVSGLTQLGARRPSQMQGAAAQIMHPSAEDATAPPSSLVSGLTNVHESS